MSNYTKSTNFATKDNLTPGDPLKIVRGTEIDTEFNNIATAIATKTDNASAAITGGAINDTTIGATTASTGAFTTLAASGNVTLSGGTANGVAYLNGSKVVTSGSALWFDGTNFGVGTGGNTLNQQSVIYKAGANAVYQQVANGSTGLGATNGIRVGLTSAGVGEWYSPTAAISYIDNTEQMRLTSTGLGIGTSSPAYKLDVSGNGIQVTSGAGQKVRLTDNIVSLLNSTAIASGYLSFKRADGTQKAAIGSYYNVADEGNLEFIGPTGSTNMLLNSSGNLGLGVTPSAWGGNYKAIQFASGSIAGYSTTSLDIYGNAYDSGAGAWKYQNSSQGATRYAAFNGQHQWFNAPSGTAGNAITFTQAMTLDASGNLGVGTTSPSEKLQVSGSTNVRIKLTESGSGVSATMLQQSVNSYLIADNAWLLYTGGSERARIDSSGNLLVGTTSAGTDKVRFSSNGATANQLGLVSADDSNGNGFIQFRRSDVTSIGSISRVGATNAVAYNTTSDYRLKTVTGSVTGQGARIDALKPIDYVWTEDGEQARGFLAHEFETVYPNSVTGKKDAVDANGNPVYQAMQAGTAEVIADLVAEIQSLRKRLADAGIA